MNKEAKLFYRIATAAGILFSAGCAPVRGREDNTAVTPPTPTVEPYDNGSFNGVPLPGPTRLLTETPTLTRTSQPIPSESATAEPTEQTFAKRYHDPNIDFINGTEEIFMTISVAPKEGDAIVLQTSYTPLWYPDTVTPEEGEQIRAQYKPGNHTGLTDWDAQGDLRVSLHSGYNIFNQGHEAEVIRKFLEGLSDSSLTDAVSILQKMDYLTGSLVEIKQEHKVSRYYVAGVARVPHEYKAAFDADYEHALDIIVAHSVGYVEPFKQLADEQALLVDFCGWGPLVMPEGLDITWAEYESYDRYIWDNYVLMLVPEDRFERPTPER